MTKAEDETVLLKHIKNFQYVEVKQAGNQPYFEVKVKHNQDVNLYLFLEGTLNPWTEQWLSN